jgi:lipopolysaccharide export system protein LptA
MHLFSAILFRYALFVFLCPWFLCQARADDDVNRPSSVLDALVPGFDKEGRISWELRATEVVPRADELYETINPFMKFFDHTGVRMEAKSSSGIFNLRNGLANGEDYLSVEGDGFSAQGKDWKWWQKSKNGSHRMIFEHSGRVSFDADLESFLSEKETGGTQGCSGEAVVLESKKALTIARANFIEFLAVNERSHHFFLEGNVSVESNELLLTSERMKVEFEKEGNSSSDEIGRISRISATGQVKFSQKGRISYCDSLDMNVLKGEVLLEGKPARVVDDEWGAAIGSRIILEKGKRRARVLGGEVGGSPRLELPPLPDLGFERKGKSP